MKEFFTNLGLIIASLFLVSASAVIFILTSIIAFLWLLYVTAWNNKEDARTIMKGVSKWFYSIALGVDYFGNGAFGGFFNDLFLVGEGQVVFGNNYETISFVLGGAFLEQNLNERGLFLMKAVNYLDLTKKEHCHMAFVSGINNAMKKVKIYESLIPIT